MKVALAVVIGFALAVLATVLGVTWADARAMPHVITVTGESRLTGEPDIALVRFGVERSGKTVGEAEQRMSVAVSRVISAVQALGVNKPDVATSALNIAPGWDYRKHVPKGYTVSSRLIVTVRDV